MDTNNVSEPVKISNSVHAPEYAPVKENELVLMSLGINADHIAALPMIVNTGEAFLLLEVKKADVLQSLRLDANNMRFLSDQYGLSGFCLFVRAADGVDASGRTFLPTPGLAGEEIRQQASGALACYLYDIAMLKQDVMNLRLELTGAQPAGANQMQVHLHLLNGKIQSWEASPRQAMA